MLTSALLLMLAANDVRPAFLSDGAPRAVQLVSRDGPRPDYRGWTVAQMRDEYERLEDLRPGTVLPITLLLTGITGFGVSLFAYGIALGNFRGADVIANSAFGLGATASVAMVTIGGIQLWHGSTDRRVYGARMETLQRLADAQERDERMLDLWEQRQRPAGPPPLIGPPPKGPPPPASAPPIIPGPPIVPGEVSLFLPLFFARF